MIENMQSASTNTSLQARLKTEHDILYLIGRSLIEHKEMLYTCNRTGLTEEVAWPIMETILCNIRPYLAGHDGAESGLKLIPCEPTPEMIRAALNASIRLRQEYETDTVEPDSPGPLPSEMVRVVWRAMLEALPDSAIAASPANVIAQDDDFPERTGPALKSASGWRDSLPFSKREKNGNVFTPGSS